MSPVPPSTDEVLPLLIPLVIRDIASLLAQSILYGVYFILIILALYHLVMKSQRSSSVIACTFVAMFAISTFLWASNLVVLLERLNIVFVRRGGPIVARLSVANAATQKLRYMDDVMFFVLYLIGDAVLAWRIVVLRQGTMWVAFVLTGLWLATFAAGTGLVGCLIRTDFPPPETLPPLCTNLGNSGWVASLTFNGVATGILACTAWSYRRTVGKLLARERTKVDRVLYTLVVSGVIYLLLGVPRLTLFANPNLNPFPTNVTYATQLIESMLYQVVGIYPTAVTAVLFLETAAGPTSTFVPRMTLSMSFAPSADMQNRGKRDERRENQRSSVISYDE